ncbi:hypothetical protein CIB84_017575 [Bambusicola thoracicus]|uniref:RanBD1 domain-containing protein n=1 Tax=Bambusicola thoracicus TaxID=9083 RepID=A0A2P4S3G9_BAMTH|nr:hypothetical protein CIB84_017575 [Bambusicola thoracicus]
MQQRKGCDRAWVQTACDFADGEGKVELLAVWFELQDVAGSFKQTSHEGKQAHEQVTLITPHVSRTTTANPSPRAKKAVAAVEATTRETTDLSRGDEACGASGKALASETPTKSIVSPAKFVFRSESVKTVFSNEKTFPYGNTAAPGSLFRARDGPSNFSFKIVEQGEC